MEIEKLLDDHILENQELYENIQESDKNELKEKYNLILKEDTFKINQFLNYYLGGMKYLFNLTKKRLSIEENKKFWENINISNLLFELNNTENLIKIISKTLFDMDMEVEVIHLIIKNYFNQIKKKISRK